MRYIFHSRLVLILVFVILTNGFSYSIAGNNVRGLKYDKVFDGPPYSPRDSNAEDLYAHRLAAAEGAAKIGSFEILASGPNEASKIASEEAAKLGADYYWIDPESGYQHTKKRYVRDGVSSTKIGNQNITTERYHYDDKAVKGIYVYSCFIYRNAPTKEKADALRSFGLFSCLSRCTSDSLTAEDVSSALELTYQLRKVNNVFQGYEIKNFFECLSQKPKPHRKYPHFIGHPKYFEAGFTRDIEKVNLLLNRGLVNRIDYYAALQMVRATHYDEERDFIEPTSCRPSCKFSSEDYKAYRNRRYYVGALKLHFEFLKQVETALVGYRLPEPSNYIGSIKAKVTNVQFYESDYDPQKKNKRVYKKLFKPAETRYIFWELNLECPPVENKKKVSLKSVIRMADGNIFGQLIRDYWIYPKATVFWLTTGWGARNTRVWKPGTYSVELYINGIFTAIGEFKVI